MAATFALDTSCMIAAVCGWHEAHRRAAAAVERRLADGEQMAVAVHALSEAYAVLTRLPAPHRLGPGDAWELLRTNFVEEARIVSLSVRHHTALLGRLANNAVGGGRVYDALIAECAVRSGAGALLTFNARHFDPAPSGLSIIVPA